MKFLRKLGFGAVMALAVVIPVLLLIRLALRGQRRHEAETDEHQEKSAQH